LVFPGYVLAGGLAGPRERAMRADRCCGATAFGARPVAVATVAVVAGAAAASVIGWRAFGPRRRKRSSRRMN
jgi:hypothetical protein